MATISLSRRFFIAGMMALIAAGCGVGRSGGPEQKASSAASQNLQEESLAANAKRVLANVRDQYRGAPPNSAEAKPTSVPNQNPATDSAGTGERGAADTAITISLDLDLLDKVERNVSALKNEVAAGSAKEPTRKPTRSRTQAYYSTDVPAPPGPGRSATGQPLAQGAQRTQDGQAFSPFNQPGGAQDSGGMPLQPGQNLQQLNQFLSANLDAGNELTKHLNMGALRLLAKKGGGPDAATATQLVTLYEVMALGQDASKSWKEGGKLNKTEAIARVLIAIAILYETRKDFINANVPVAGNLYAMQSVIGERSQIQQAILNTRINGNSATPETTNALQTLQGAYKLQQQAFNSWLTQSRVDRGQVVDYAIKTAAGAGPEAAASVMRGALLADQGIASRALTRMPGMSPSRLAALQAQSLDLAQPSGTEAIPLPLDTKSTQPVPTSLPRPAKSEPAPVYNQLPPAQRTEVGKGGAGAGTITIANQTDYQMDISFSGPSDTSAVVPRHGSRTLALSEGNYQINARLPERPLVRPFQGTDYYRSTERYALSLYLRSQPR